MSISSSFNNKAFSDRINPAWPILIIVAAFVCYIPAMRGGFIWDDHAHVLFDPAMHDIAGLYKIWFTRATQQYYPFVYSSFWIEWQLWGDNPFGYHIVNVAIHAANAILFGLILIRLRVPGAWVAALIFALHPVHVESVAWISERKNVLSGLLYLASILAILKHEDDHEPRWYAISLLLFLLALFSKTVVSTLPVVLLIIRWMRGKRIDFRYILSLVPFFLLGLAMGLLTVWWEATQVGASGTEWAMTPLERLMIPARVVWFYLVKLFIPVKLTFIYPRWTPDPSILWQWIFIVKLAIAFLVLWAIRRLISRAPVAALACFVITLFPALGLIDVFPFRYSFVADHFQYLASLFIIAPAVAIVAIAISSYARAVRSTGIFITVVVVVLLGVLTWNQGYAYRDRETLWRDVLDKNPNAWIAHNNLGQILYERGEVTTALEHYRRAVEIWPNAREARHNLAASLVKTGNLGEAEVHFRAALVVSPNASHTLSELGTLLSQTGRSVEAFALATRAVAIAPQDADIQNNLGIVLLRSGRTNEAISVFMKAIEIKPDFLEAISNIGIANSLLGKDKDALAAFTHALSIDPDYIDGHYNIAVTYEDLGKIEKAVSHYKEAIKLDPGHAQSLNNLGNIAYKKGNYSRAENYYRAALKANKNLRGAEQNLKRTLRKLSK